MDATCVKSQWRPECPFSVQVEQASEIQLNYRPISDTMHWVLFVQELFQKMTQEEIESMSVIWEPIWIQRNEVWQGMLDMCGRVLSLILGTYRIMGI